MAFLLGVVVGLAFAAVVMGIALWRPGDHG